MIILTDFHSFTVNEEKLRNYSIWIFLRRSWYAILVKIWNWLKLLNSVQFMKKTLVNHLYIWILIILTVFSSFTVNEVIFKISQFEDFWLGQGMWYLSKFWKWLKVLNSVPFIKKTLVNQVYIRIWSFWQTFAVLQWMKKNSKINKISSFLLRSGHAI